LVKVSQTMSMKLFMANNENFIYSSIKLRYLLDQLAKIQILNNFHQKFPGLSYDEICEMVYTRAGKPL
jgi:hypothetical protein